MREVHFQSLDLNLLRVFDALAEERSVTRAGERLGLTQSAVSHALNRLRYVLEDDLFQRGPDGMTPTPRAVEIWPELRRGLAQLQHALTPTEFTPADAERSFSISASAYLGEILFHERLVWVVRADHPAASDPAPLKAVEKLPLVLLAPGNRERPPADRSSRLIEPLVMWEDLASDQTPLGRGASQRIRVVVDNSHEVLAIVATSDMAALAPYRLARSRQEALGLKLVDLPPNATIVASFEAIWRADRSAHPALGWLRGILRDASREA